MKKLSWRAIGRRLRTARIVLGLTEKQAADVFGVSLRTYRGYEAGHPERGSRGSGRFSHKYKVSIGWIIEGAGRTVGRHLAEDAPGKVAILPVITRGEREIILANKQEAKRHFRFAQQCTNKQEAEEHVRLSAIRAWLATTPVERD
jgi:transcriptional regulator with XRE-family HTH domain